MKTLSSFISEHPEELVAAEDQSRSGAFATSSASASAAATANASNGQQQTTKWKSLRAVMAYYCSLRRIKRNVATHKSHFQCSVIAYPRFASVN